MPYPLLKLPYDLQRRLRSLTIPKEAYCLQVAAGFEQNYLQPLQMCAIETDPEAYIRRDGKKLFATRRSHWPNPESKIDYDNESLILLNKFVEFDLLTPSDYYAPMFEHFLLKGESFSFCSSELNPAIFDKVVGECDPERVRSFAATHKISPDLTVPMICSKLKNLRHLSIEARIYTPKHWMKDILKFRKLNLWKMTVSGEFDDLFSFDHDEVSQLFERENPNFKMILVCWVPPRNALELIRERFGAHFKEFKTEKYQEGFLHVEIGNVLGSRPIGESYFNFCFQIRPSTDS